jgi:CD109 antigen
VEYPEQIMPKPEGHFFDITIVDKYQGRNFSIMHSTVCAKWARPDISNTTGMTVMEIHMPTGYIITNDVLRSYAQSGIVPTLRRAEAYGRKVVFYFDTVTATDFTCVDFRTDRWFPVSNMTIQHIVKVYDYYEPGMHNTTLYTTYDLYTLHVCQVCGSFQCPYCPFYNAATSLNFSILVSLVAVVTSLIISRKLTSR